MQYLMLIATLITATIQGIFAKEYFVRTKNSSPMLYSFISVSFALLYFVIYGTISGGLDFSNILAYLPYSLAFALAYGSAVYGSKAALKCGPLALGTLFGACSILIPTFLGILFLGDEMLPPSRIAGLVLLIAAIAVANLKKEDARINFIWIIFVLMNILGNGFCSFTQAAQVKFQGSDYGDEFMICALAVVAIFMGIATFTGSKNLKAEITESNVWLYGILAGIANGFTNMMVMLLVAMNVPQSIIQPTVSAGGLVLTVIAAVFLYKEKQSRMKVLSFVLGTVSLILLNV